MGKICVGVDSECILRVVVAGGVIGTTIRAFIRDFGGGRDRKEMF